MSLIIAHFFHQIIGPNKCNPIMTNIYAFSKLNNNNYYMQSQQIKSNLEAHMLQISYIEFNISPSTRLLPNPPKKCKTPASPTTLIQTTKRASVIGTALAVSLSTAPTQATSVPILSRIKTTLSDLDDKDNTFSPENVAQKRKWEQYCKWVQNNHTTMDLIDNILNPSQWSHVHSILMVEGM